MKYEEVFCDIEKPLNLKTAQIESSRCYYCYDAPCITACPTGIDIPSFVRKISNGNVKGAALDILSANVMGGTCARACPVETLCQEACVREKSEKKPVAIGQLQRFATDEYFKTGEQAFTRAPTNGIKIAVVGAGPAGLSCAHHLARLGYDITIFESRAKAGGLNEFGLAPYKLTNEFAQQEVNYILSIGGITIEYGKSLGKEITLDDLRGKFSAVFLGVGLGGNNSLGIPGEESKMVIDATRMIEKIRQTKDLSKIPVPKNVIVIGGGNTSVDIAIQMKKLGSEFVTIAYRRGRTEMGATHHEQELALTHGVQLLNWVKPVKIEADSMQFEYTQVESGKLLGTGKMITLKAEAIYKAIGQTLVSSEKVSLKNGKISVNEKFETSLSGVYAGGDCTGVGEDLTVTAVQHGKLAARSIHEKLGARKHG